MFVRCQYSSKLWNDLRRHFKRKNCKVLFKELIYRRVRMVLDEEYTCKKAEKKTCCNNKCS